jgi:hypothetical protein
MITTIIALVAGYLGFCVGEIVVGYRVAKKVKSGVIVIAKEDEYYGRTSV